jgi:hypothetical protein
MEGGTEMNENLLRGELVHLTHEEPEVLARLESQWQGDSEYSRLLDWDPARRVSATTTSIPRAARSMAAVRPTGPAPTTSTCVCVELIYVQSLKRRFAGAVTPFVAENPHQFTLGQFIVHSGSRKMVLNS